MNIIEKIKYKGECKYRKIKPVVGDCIYKFKNLNGKYSYLITDSTIKGKIEVKASGYCLGAIYNGEPYSFHCVNHFIMECYNLKKTYGFSALLVDVKELIKYFNKEEE